MPSATCRVESCDSLPPGRGLCEKHRARKRRGRPLDVEPSRRPKSGPARCTRCGATKPWEAFRTLPYGSASSHCLDCEAEIKRDANLKSKYGLTWEERQALDRGACAACGDPGPLVVDHDHETGAVRGLICQPCNLALGALRDSPQRMDSLALYIETHADGHPFPGGDGRPPNEIE